MTDAALILGAIAVVYGSWLAAPWAAFVVGGVMLVLWAAGHEIGKRAKR
jgi:hypothetical protein